MNFIANCESLKPSSLTSALLFVGMSLVQTSLSTASQPVGLALDSLTIPSQGGVATSSVSLTNGQEYWLLAEGAVTIDDQGSTADAEWIMFIAQPWTENPGNPSYDILVDGAESNWLGSSLLNPDPIADFATFAVHQRSESHQYWLPIIGDGSSIQLHFQDGDYSDNNGSMSVSIFAPEPSTLAILLLGGVTAVYRKRNPAKAKSIGR